MPSPSKPVHRLNPEKRLRRSSRIIVLGPDRRALMFRFNIPGREPFWVTAGGECDPDESYEEAARRELHEETGIVADPGAQIARTTPEFVTPEGEPVQADERYFMVSVASSRIETANHTALERRVMTEHRWFTLHELECWHEAVFPEEIASIIRQETET